MEDEDASRKLLVAVAVAAVETIVTLLYCAFSGSKKKEQETF